MNWKGEEVPMMLSKGHRYFMLLHVGVLNKMKIIRQVWPYQEQRKNKRLKWFMRRLSDRHSKVRRARQDFDRCALQAQLHQQGDLCKTN